MKQKKTQKREPNWFSRDMSPLEVSRYGFRWGCADITRAISHKEYRVLQIATKRGELQINISPTGRLRVFTIRPTLGELKLSRPTHPQPARL